MESLPPPTRLRHLLLRPSWSLTRRASSARIAKFVLALSVLTFFATASNRLESAPSQQREILVASFEDGFSARWCGNRALIVKGGKPGIIWIDFLQKKRIQISTTVQDGYYGCTFDGAWVVYSDIRSIRTDRDFRPDPAWHGAGWQGGIVDLWRYELATGRRQRFAVVRTGGGYSAMAPSKYRIFLGGRHNSSIPMPAPRWEAFWFDNPDWSGDSNLLWLRDSSGVVARGDRVVYVKVFGRGGWEATLNPELGDGFGTVDTDAGNRLYLNVKQDLPGRRPPEQWFLTRCDLTSQSLVGCTVLLKDAGVFRVLPTGEIKVEERDNICIRRFIPRQAISGCLVARGNYGFLALHGVSAEGRWLAFSRWVKLATTGRRDLFVLPL